MLHCVEWERRRGSERERGGREGANYSNNNDNIVNLTLIIISINLDQEWGMSKINRKDKLFFTTQKLGSFSFLQHAINPQNHLGHCTWTVFSIHSLSLRSQITDGSAGRVMTVLSVSHPVVLHHCVHLVPRLPVPLPAPGLQVQVQNVPEPGHVPLEALHWVPDEDESNQSEIVIIMVKNCRSILSPLTLRWCRGYTRPAVQGPGGCICPGLRGRCPRPRRGRQARAGGGSWRWGHRSSRLLCLDPGQTDTDTCPEMTTRGLLSGCELSVTTTQFAKIASENRQ